MNLDEDGQNQEPNDFTPSKVKIKWNQMDILVSHINLFGNRKFILYSIKTFDLNKIYTFKMNENRISDYVISLIKNILNSEKN